jgi:hypothetical protein
MKDDNTQLKNKLDINFLTLALLLTALVFSLSFASSALANKYSGEIKETLNLFDASGSVLEVQKWVQYVIIDSTKSEIKQALVLIDFSDQFVKQKKEISFLKKKLNNALSLFDISGVVAGVILDARSIEVRVINYQGLD